MPPDLRKYHQMRVAATTLSAICPCSRAPSRRRARTATDRSEEHTSELQSQSNLVCRLLLEKKNLTTYLSFLTLFWITTPLAFHYTIPYDHMSSPVHSSCATQMSLAYEDLTPLVLNQRYGYA